MAAAAAGSWFLLRTPSDPLELVPAGVPAVLMIRELPPSLDFLAETRAARWLDLQPEEFRHLLAQGEGTDSFSELMPLAASAILILHDLTPRDEGRFRIEFSAVLVPRFPGWLVRDELRQWIVSRTVARFAGEGQVTTEEGPPTVIRGTQPGHELFLWEWSGWLLLSNSERSRRLIQHTAVGGGPRLVDTPSFQDCRRRVAGDPDLLLYVRGGDRFGLIPEFIWAVSLDGGRVQETYSEAR